MMLGIGDTTTGATVDAVAFTTATPGFTDGLGVWTSPSNGITALQNIFSNFSTAFAGTTMPVTLGILAVPVGIVLLVASVAGGGSRR